jgi:hypothetical protein
MTSEFVSQVLGKLRGEAKRVVEQDVVLSHMLIVEFGTHPRHIHSSVKLCKLVCGFFAPLLTIARVELPVKLLQFRYEMVLSHRLRDYNSDTKNKA